MLTLAASRHAMWAMAAISFAESSFLPLPPDILLVPMILAQPRRAWLIAAVCTVASVLGGFVGYAIGYFLFDAIGRPVLEFYHAMDKYEALKAAFDINGVGLGSVEGGCIAVYETLDSALAAARSAS